MAKRKHQISRMLLSSVIMGLAIVSAGCSYVISFNLKNLSGQTITINYTVKNIGKGLAPMLVKKNTIEGRTESVPVPDDRISVDIENGSAEFKLLANEEVVIDRIIDGRESDYEQTFNIKSLRISGEDGSIDLEGRQAFKSFLPIRKSWYTFGPEIIGFVFEYR